MAQIYLKLILFCINILTIYASSSAFKELLDDTSVCEENCTKSFAPHTYPNGTDNDACMRGCRLYTITSFVAADEPDHPNSIIDDGLTPSKRGCYDSCIEAYNETSPNTSACKVGCDIQEMISLGKKKEQPKDEGIHRLIPVMQVREVVSKVVGMLRIIQSSITTFFVGDDDGLIAMEGPVEVVVQVLPPELQEKQEIKREPENRQVDSDGLISSGAASIECLSRRVGVPPYLLIVSLVSFIIFLSYILFIICSSSGKKEKTKSGMSIPAHALPVKLVRPEDLTKLSLMDEEDGQAPALPTKVKLPDTNI